MVSGEGLLADRWICNFCTMDAAQNVAYTDAGLLHLRGNRITNAIQADADLHRWRLAESLRTVIAG